MPELTRTQLVVYAAVAIVALLLGARWIRSADDDPARSGALAFAQGDEPPDDGDGDGGNVMVAPSAGDVLVHVAGAVRRPGVYRLPASARVADAVKRAGGATAAGDADSINLAARLADGQQVIVPAAAPAGASSASAGASSSPAPDAPISLGTATVEQLDTIEGIGPVTAQEIISFRDRNGGLSSIDELDQISGIGPATMEALRARLQP